MGPDLSGICTFGYSSQRSWKCVKLSFSSHINSYIPMRGLRVSRGTPEFPSVADGPEIAVIRLSITPVYEIWRCPTRGADWFLTHGFLPATRSPFLFVFFEIWLWVPPVTRRKRPTAPQPLPAAERYGRVLPGSGWLFPRPQRLRVVD